LMPTKMSMSPTNQGNTLPIQLIIRVITFEPA
jgi:hypothetical protein